MHAPLHIGPCLAGIPSHDDLFCHVLSHYVQQFDKAQSLSAALSPFVQMHGSTALSPAERLRRRYGGTGPTQLAVQLRRSKHLPIPAGLAYADAAREDLTAGSSAASAAQQTPGSAGAVGAGAGAGSGTAGAQVQGPQPFKTLPAAMQNSRTLSWAASSMSDVLLHAVAQCMHISRHQHAPLRPGVADDI